MRGYHQITINICSEEVSSYCGVRLKQLPNHTQAATLNEISEY